MNTKLISLKYQYFSQLRKPVRDEVLKLMEGADIDSVSSDAVLAYRIINHFEQEAAAAAASAPAAAASNVAASNNVANNQCVKAEVAESSSAAASPQDPQVEPRLASAQPDGPVNDAANEAMVDAGVVDAGVDEVGEVGRPSCMPRQASALPVDESVSMEDVGEPEWAEELAAVRCEGRPQVWLDMERLTVEETQALFPGTTWASLEQALPVEEFRRGSTLNGVEAGLLKPTVLNVRPDKHIDAALRMDLLVYDIYQLIKSRRCLLFEQVRALLNSDFTNECYAAVSDAFARESDREDFLSMSRTERLHAVAQLWIINVLAMREDCKQQVA